MNTPLPSHLLPEIHQREVPAALIDALVYTRSRNEKLRLIAEYLRQGSMLASTVRISLDARCIR